ncbi:DUF4118 domain-containing protein [Lapillicoccus jejuensis]|uniref:Uncharacterized protein DUF4118 n=1 Tax=Lapillicoccus jejuensis TaxID=402171 RepID=A0A542E188_9MICO|nr:DUF4118 domain-containing protein [Lapillicoccus jejuensis]TQJ09106.1 uncharacterized protein DUF4118 [Lapillicoccus jejuensis]
MENLAARLRVLGAPGPALRTVAVLAPVLVTALLALVRDQVSAAPAALVLVLVVTAVASTGDRVAAVLSAVVGGLSFDFFLTAPYETLAISNRDDVEAFVLVVLVGLAVTELALWGRRRQAEASRTSGYLDGALAAAEVVASAPSRPGEGPADGSADPLVRVVTCELTALLRLDACRWEPGRTASGRTVVQPDGSLLRGGRTLDPGRAGLPTDDETSLPVRHGGQTVGTLVLTTATAVRRPSREQLRVAVLLADQLGRRVTAPDIIG